MLRASYCDSAVSFNFLACVRSRGHIFSPIIMKLGQKVCLESRTSSKVGHIESKTRSLGQILEIPCVHSRVQIFSHIFMEVGHNVSLDEISNTFENMSCGVKS